MSSAPSSGRSTPRGSSMTPPPHAPGTVPSTEGGGPNPLTVGTHFVKQYYKVLSTSPEQIVRFYQPTSVLSKGVGSQPTQPATLLDSTTTTTGSSSPHSVQDRFVLPGFEQCPIRFEFEHGAIDAQVSVNNGVLLVVTGHIVYTKANNNSSSTEAAAAAVPATLGGEKRKAFVHTFFLGSTSLSSTNKRSYYVHNDILRFLHEDSATVSEEEEEEEAETTTVVASNRSSLPTRDAPPAVDKMELPVPVPVPVELPREVTTPTVATVGSNVTRAAPLEPADEAPGGGVEETKEALVEEDVDGQAKGTDIAATRDAEPTKESIAAVDGGVAAAETDKGPLKLDEAKVKPTPGSWASLVASGGSNNNNGAGSTPATPTRGTPVRPTKPISSTSSPAVAAVKSPAPPTPPGAPAPVAAAAAAVATAPGVVAATLTDASKVDGSRPKYMHIKRDPDCTLVIKNISVDTREADVLGLFESFATATDGKVVGLTVSGHKGIAFIDYDSSAPVLAAVEQHGKIPFQINGRELDIYQKTFEQRKFKPAGGRGSYRGGGGYGSVGGGGTQPGNGSSFRGGPGGSSSGGRQPYRRGGRGERDRRGGGVGGR